MRNFTCIVFFSLNKVVQRSGEVWRSRGKIANYMKCISKIQIPPYRSRYQCALKSGVFMIYSFTIMFNAHIFLQK